MSKRENSPLAGSRSSVWLRMLSRIAANTEEVRLYQLNTLDAEVIDRVVAFLQGRGYVTPQDVKDIAPDVLRHRVILTYEAEAEEISTNDIVQRILNHVEVP